MSLMDWRCAVEVLEDCICVIGGLHLKDWRCVFEGLEVCV